MNLNRRVTRSSVPAVRKECPAYPSPAEEGDGGSVHADGGCLSLGDVPTDDLRARIAALEAELLRRGSSPDAATPPPPALAPPPEEGARQAEKSCGRGSATAATALQRPPPPPPSPPAVSCAHLTEEQFFRSLSLMNVMVVAGSAGAPPAHAGSSLPSPYCTPRAEERQLVVVVEGKKAKLVRLQPIVLRLFVASSPPHPHPRAAGDGSGGISSSSGGGVQVIRVEVEDRNGYAHHRNYAPVTAKAGQGHVELLATHDFNTAGDARAKAQLSSSSSSSSRASATPAGPASIGGVVLILTEPAACRAVLDDICHGYLPDFLMGVYPHGIEARGEWRRHTVGDDQTLSSSASMLPTGGSNSAALPLSVGAGSHVRRLQSLRQRGPSHPAQAQQPPPHEPFAFGSHATTTATATHSPSLRGALTTTPGPNELTLRVLTPAGEAFGVFLVGTTVGHVQRALLAALQQRPGGTYLGATHLALAYLGAAAALAPDDVLSSAATLRLVTRGPTVAERTDA